MELKEHFELSGQLLFRWRSFLPLFLIGPLIGAVATFEWPFGRHELQEVWETVCLAVSGTGLAMRVLVAGSVPGGTSGRNTREQRANSLNTTGMYSLIRHPLYLGNFLIVLGWSLFFSNAWFVVTCGMAFCLYYERIMMTEEAFLRQRFGSEFQDWATVTPAFFPRQLRWKPPALPFCWRTAMAREYHTVMMMVGVFLAFELLEHWKVENALVLEPAWIVIGSATLILYLIARALKKCTQVLRIDGR